MALVRKTLLSVVGSETIDGPEYEVVWKVTTDSVDDGPFTVRGFVGVSYGDPYSYGNDNDPLARCTRIAERAMGSSKFDWEVTLNYTRPPREESGERSESDNPINDPIQIEWGYEERQRTTLLDIHGKPIVNPCGDPYDELIAVDDFRRTLTIVRNEKTFPRALADALSNKLTTSHGTVTARKRSSSSQSRQPISGTQRSASIGLCGMSSSWLVLVKLGKQNSLARASITTVQLATHLLSDGSIYRFLNRRA